MRKTKGYTSVTMSATTTAVRERKTSKQQPEPPETTPQRSRWADRILSATHCLLRLSEYLTTPPPGTPLSDLFDVQAAILDPEVFPQHAQGTLLMAVAFGDKGVSLNPQGDALDRLAGKMASRDAGSDVKTYRTANVLDVCQEIDKLITERCRAGLKDERIVHVATPQRVFVTGGHDYGWDGGFATVRVQDLPDWHSLKNSTELGWFRLGDGSPAAVLGPCEKAVIGGFVARPWYSTQTVLWSTARLRMAQIRRKKEEAAKLPLQEQLGMAAQGYDPREPTRVAEPPLQTPKPLLDAVQPPPRWIDKVKLALDVCQRPQDYFRFPGADVGLDDMLLISQLWDIRDWEAEPARWAA